MMRLLLARHGQTQDNVEGRIQGRNDVPLNDEGRSQTRLLAKRLSAMKIDAIYSSPLRRAWETAMPVVGYHDVDVQANDWLMEASYGVWDGLTWPEVRNRYPLAFAEWAVDRDRVPEGAETVHQVSNRANNFLGQIRRDHRKETVLVITHGGPLRVLVCIAFGMDLKKSFDMAIDNTAISELTFSPRGVILRRHNDSAHLFSME